MNHLDPDDREWLAAEYVLGTLQGAERERFEALLREDPALKREVEAWERRLNPLAEFLPPLEPPPDLWERIAAQTQPPQIQKGIQKDARRRLWNNLPLWRGLALAASLAALALFLRLLWGPMVGAPDYVGLIADAQQRTVWVLNADTASRQLTIKVLRPIEMPPNRACELWLVRNDGRTYSLGMLPESGTKTLPLPAPGSELFDGARQLKVTLEPPGGSPTEQPSGPVLYEGTILTLG